MNKTSASCYKRIKHFPLSILPGPVLPQALEKVLKDLLALALQRAAVQPGMVVEALLKQVEHRAAGPRLVARVP